MFTPNSYKYTSRLFGLAASTDYSDQPMPASPGVYFENLGTVHVAVGQWKVISYLHLWNFQDKLNNFKAAVKETQSLCNERKFPELNCNSSISLLNGKVDTLIAADERLTHLAGHAIKKRALFGFIGYALKSLFGTLDEYDAEYYNDAINKAASNEANLAQLLKEQSQVVQSTITNFNATISQINRDAEVFNKNIDNLRAFTKKTSQMLEQVDFKANLNSHLTHLIIFAERLTLQYTQLTDAILFAKANILHPSIMTPTQLINSLKESFHYLPSGSTYPVALDPDLSSQILAVSNINLYYEAKRLICVIRIPLVTSIVFNLYNIIPFPSHYNRSTYFFIQPKVKYLALCDDKRQYTTFDDLNTCKLIDENERVCSAVTPISSTLMNPICETEATFIRQKVPKQCQVQPISLESPIWRKLHGRNTWLYAIPQSSPITITCHVHPSYDILLNYSGLFSLNPGCTAYSGSTILSPSVIKESNVTHFLPNFSIGIDDCCHDWTQNRNRISLDFAHIKPVNAKFQDLYTASHKLDNLQKLADIIVDQEVHKRRTSIMEYVGYSIISVIIFYFITRYGPYLFRLIGFCLKPSIPSSAQHPAICCTIFNVCSERNTTEHVSLEDVSSSENPETVPMTSSGPKRSGRLRERTI